VIGLPDSEYGNTVHAIVDIADKTVRIDGLLDFLRERLTSYKLPRSIELVSEILRDDAGKIRRSELRSQRLAERNSGGEN